MPFILYFLPLQQYFWWAVKRFLYRKVWLYFSINFRITFKPLSVLFVLFYVSWKIYISRLIDKIEWMGEWNYRKFSCHFFLRVSTWIIRTELHWSTYFHFWRWCTTIRNCETLVQRGHRSLMSIQDFTFWLSTYSKVAFDGERDSRLIMQVSK